MPFQLRSVVHTLSLAAILVCGVACGSAETPPEWPRFRGLGGLGVALPKSGALPVSWDADGTGIRWVRAIEHPGVSSPIVGGGRVFLTGEERSTDETELVVMALDPRTGASLWTTRLFSRQRESFPHRSVQNTPAGPTPVTDGRAVYAYFGSHLAAVRRDGRLLWLQEIDPWYLESVRYGAASSPVLAGDAVVVMRDHESGDDGRVGWMSAFDVDTGRLRWRTEWRDSCCSYTTPLVVERAGSSQIVVSLSSRVVGVDAATGERIWERPQDVNQPVASPVLVDGILCSATGAHGVRQANCWRFSPEHREPSVEPLWTERKGIPATGSPVLYRGLFFTLHERGFLYCYDSETGRRRCRRRLERGPYHASLLAGDGKLYAISRHGLVSVLSATRKPDLLAENQLPGENVVASPAVGAGCLLVRTESSLICVEGMGDEAAGALEDVGADGPPTPPPGPSPG